MLKNKEYTNRYTIVYYEVMEDFQISIPEYLILNEMARQAKANDYKKGLKHLKDITGMSRNTIYKYIERLITKEHIEKEKTTYHLHYDVKERFIPIGSQPKYLIIFHDVRKLYSLSITESALLYLFYSFSRSSFLNGGTNAPCRVYIQILEITERAYYDMKKKIINLNLINCDGGNYVSVSPHIIELFDQKVQYINECSKSSDE